MKLLLRWLPLPAVLVLAWCVSGCATGGSATAAKPLRALMITGGCCHDYPGQKSILSEGISARARVEWTIVHDPRTGTTGKIETYRNPNWASGYDVIVHNECFSDEKELDWLEGILKPHREGVPAVLIHCTMHCYRAPTNDWFKFCGVRSHRHGAHFAYPMMNQRPDHPIMKSFPAIWNTPMEELYNIVEVFPETTVLASGYSHETKKGEPNVWINQFGKARVFGTTVGHYNHTLRDPVMLDVLTRGLLWACGKLDREGRPVRGYEVPNAPAGFSR
ncbi:MAG: ThuA domain-containing protein [Verrucomicrobia bacterium]|nr:ThuA domain-containing protein [Verrucomicrobiota bacterium]